MVTGPEPAIGMSVWWRGTGAGAEGPAVEVAAVSVVGTPVLGGGVSGGSGTQFSCVANEMIIAWVRYQIWSC